VKIYGLVLQVRERLDNMIPLDEEEQIDEAPVIISPKKLPKKPKEKV